MGGLNQAEDLTRIPLTVPTSALRWRKHKRPTVKVGQVPKYEALVMFLSPTNALLYYTYKMLKYLMINFTSIIISLIAETLLPILLNI